MTRIITDGLVGDDTILVDEVQIKYVQAPDNCSGEDDYQELTLMTKDGGSGKYINFKTGEHGWSVNDDMEDLNMVFDHFKKIIYE